MSGLEKIVRPYQTRQITPPKPVISVIKNGTQADNVVLEYGKSWNIKSLNGSETVDITYYMEKWMKEKKTAT